MTMEETLERLLLEHELTGRQIGMMKTLHENAIERMEEADMDFSNDARGFYLDTRSN